MNIKHRLLTALTSAALVAGVFGSALTTPVYASVIGSNETGTNANGLVYDAYSTVSASRQAKVTRWPAPWRRAARLAQRCWTPLRVMPVTAQSKRRASLIGITAMTPASCSQDQRFSVIDFDGENSRQLMIGSDLVRAVLAILFIFGVPAGKLDVLVHPQSIVHGLVTFADGSVIAGLANPDMRVPIAHCLAWPERIDGPAERLNLARIGSLQFEAPDTDRFPALAIARRVLEAGGATATVFNAANEVAVAFFVDRKLGFAGIAALVEATIDAAERRNATNEPQTIEDALAVDHIARSLAQDLLPEIAVKSS